MQVVRDLLASRKFVASLIGVVSGVAIKLGVPETSVAELAALLSPILAYIGAQGLADMGKEKAVVEAVANDKQGVRL